MDPRTAIGPGQKAVGLVVADDPEAAWPRIRDHLSYMLASYHRLSVEGTDAPVPRPIDPERRRPVPAFATPTIVGSLRRHYRDLGWGMRVPRRIHEIAAPVRETSDRLTMELGRSPLVGEVAQGFKCGIVVANFQDVKEGDVLEAYTARQVERELEKAR
mgnify:CR=1 FL=1